MALSTKFSYYSDFVVYPIAIVAIGGRQFTPPNLRSGETWLGACLLGFVLWTLLEYVLHRIALHRMPIFSPMHSLHHDAPLAYIGNAVVDQRLGLAGRHHAAAVVVGRFQRRGWPHGRRDDRLLVVWLCASCDSSSRAQAFVGLFQRAARLAHAAPPFAEARQLRRHHAPVGLCIRYRHIHAGQSIVSS